MPCVDEGHSNYFGIDERLGPVAISLKKDVITDSNAHENSRPRMLYRLIVRTSDDGDPASSQCHVAALKPRQISGPQRRAVRPQRLHCFFAQDKERLRCRLRRDVDDFGDAVLQSTRRHGEPAESSRKVVPLLFTKDQETIGQRERRPMDQAALIHVEVFRGSHLPADSAGRSPA